VTSATWVRASARKEFRALLPVASASAAALIGVALFATMQPGPLARLLGLAACAIGLVTTGAWSVGHEYACRTLGFHLGQPVDRWRLFAMKQVALAVVLAALCAVAWMALAGWEPVDTTRIRLLAVTLSLASALGTAPALTMICRSPLAGAVFTLAIPACIWVVGDILSSASGMAPGSPVARLQLMQTWLVAATAATAIVGGAVSWRLQASIEAQDRSDASPIAGLANARTEERARALRRVQHPLWLLLKKELHLQKMPIVISGLFVLVWSALTLVDQPTDVVSLSPIPVVTQLYCIITPLLVGSLASAEERQLGTREWQQLLPMSHSQQWAMKVGSVLSLSLLLSVGIPVLLAAVHPSSDDIDLRVKAVVVVLGLAITSLYVSTVSRSGLWGFVSSIPVAIGGSLLVVLLFALPSDTAWSAVVSRPARFLSNTIGRSYVLLFAEVVITLATAGLALTILWLASKNHRDAAPARALARQVGCLFAAIALWVFTLVSMAALVVAIQREGPALPSRQGVAGPARQPGAEWPGQTGSWQRTYQTNPVSSGCRSRSSRAASASSRIIEKSAKSKPGPTVQPTRV